MRKIINKLVEQFKLIDVNRLPGAIILMMVTVIITALVQNAFWIYQDDRQLKQELRQNQIQIISDIVDNSIELESIRSKVYWNDYNRTLATELLNNTKNIYSSEIHAKEIEESIKNRDLLGKEYYDEYEKSISLFYSTIVKSELYFSVSKNIVQSLRNKQSKAFSFDFEFINNKIDETEASNKDFEEFSQQLEKIAEKNYNKDFYNEVMNYVKELHSQIK